MRIGVFGAGSIGCFVGGRLLAAGHDVVLVGRMGAEVAAHGLTLSDWGGRRWRVPAVRYEAEAGSLGDREAVLVAVKSPDTAAAAATLAPTLAPGTVVVSFQNGVGNVEVLRAGLPACTVLAGMVPFNVIRQGEGRFHNGTSGPLELERRAGAEQPLVAALADAGFEVVLHDDLARTQWSKLLVNLNNPLNALAGVPLREQLGDREHRRVMAAVVREAMGCLRAAGIRPVRIGRMIPSLAPFVLSLPDWLFFRIASTMVKIDPAARSSMWEDLARGRPTEVEHLNGAIIRLGEQHGVPTPLNRRVRELVLAAEGRGSPGLDGAALRAAVLGPG